MRSHVDWSSIATEDAFGISVAISGDTALVGASKDADKGNNSGSAYIFVRSGTAWSQQAKLTASDGAAEDRFGGSVSISVDTALVGAGSGAKKGNNSGSSYVFVRSGTTWSQQDKLTASDGASGDEFGFFVALSGDTALVGARRNADKGNKSGSAYTFVHSGTAWSQRAKLTASDGASGDRFGQSVAISGDTALVGAVADADKGIKSGSVYIYE